MDLDPIEQLGSAFKARASETLSFLATEFGFEAPVDESQHYTYRLVFRHPSTQEAIHVVVSYRDTPDVFEFVVDYVLPEDWECVYGFEMGDQEPGLWFLEPAAQKLREYLKNRRFAEFKYV